MYGAGIFALLVLFVIALVLARLVHHWITKPIVVPWLARKTGEPVTAATAFALSTLLLIVLLSLPYAPPMAYGAYLCASQGEKHGVGLSPQIAALAPAEIAKLYDTRVDIVDKGMGVYLTDEIAYDIARGAEIARATTASWLGGLPLLPDPHIRCANYPGNIATVLKVIEAREFVRNSR